MTYLCLDTSSEHGLVSLILPSGDVSEIVYPAGKEGGAQLLPLCESLLEKHKLKLDDLSGLVVGIGPGSFTGIRVAVAVVQGFSLAKKLPIYPISSLCFYASQAQDRFAVMHDARRGEVYVCQGAKKDGGFEWSESYLANLEELAEDDQFPVLWMGPHIESLVSKVSKKIAYDDAKPSAKHIQLKIAQMKREKSYLNTPPIPQSYLRSVVSPKKRSTTT